MRYIVICLLVLVLLASCSQNGEQKQEPTPSVPSQARETPTRSPTVTITATEKLTTTLPTHASLGVASPTQTIPTTNAEQLMTITNTLPLTAVTSSDAFTLSFPFVSAHSSTTDTQPLTLSTTNLSPEQQIEPLLSKEETDRAELAILDSVQRLPYNRVALARAFLGLPNVSDVASTTPLSLSVGMVQEFWVNNLAKDTNYQIQAELRYMGPVVLMYVEKGMAVDQAALEQTAQTFEQKIYPFTRQLFGSEWQPGVDGDPRITILNVESRGDNAIGYFSPRDSVPQSVNRYSNEREMFYMKITPDQAAYLPTLTHEFQHMIHWNEQRRSDTWFQEGCSKLAEDLNGYGNDSFVGIYLRNPDTQLNAWADSSGQTAAHYGASNLFMRYIYSQYANKAGLSSLLRSDASNNLQAFATMASMTRPNITNFNTLFGDWAVANVINDLQVADGRYTYDLQQGQRRREGGLSLLSGKVTTTPITVGIMSDTIAQFGVDYLALPAGSFDVVFTGTVGVSVTGTMPQGRFAWWSDRGDSSIATMTRTIDLHNTTHAMLQFDTWYEMETNYDYAFVAVSTDDGKTWKTLPGTHTTMTDPQGANYGHGYTGISGSPDIKVGSGVRGKWITETIDLSAYDGMQIQLGFWQINDEGYNATGFLVDAIRICKNDQPTICVLNDTVERASNDWHTQGFVRIDGDLAQQWELRIVRTNLEGTVTVETLPVDATGQARTSVAAGEQAVLVIAAVTPHTTEKAVYQLAVQHR